MSPCVRRVASIALALFAFAHAQSARAQLNILSDTGFSLERLTPAPGNTPFLSMDHADTLPRGAMSFNLSASLMSRPIALRDLSDDELVTVPVESRLGLEMSVARGLGTRFQAGLAVPVIGYQSGDRLRDIGLDETKLAHTTMGDIRLHSKVRLVGRPGQRGPAVAAGFDVTMPTGDAEQFAGERGWIAGFRILGSWRHRWFGAGIDLSARLRTQEVVLLSPARPHNNEFAATLGVAANVPGLTRFAASVAAEYAFVLADKASGGSRGPSPGEARVGGRVSLCTGLSFTLGAGVGTTPNDVGSPKWRFFGSVRYDTSSIADIDHDGVEDGRDQCRQAAEDHDGFEDRDGCPDTDNDNDGYPDFADDCPDQAEDYDGHRDVDGCPDDQRPVGRLSTEKPITITDF